MLYLFAYTCIQLITYVPQVYPEKVAALPSKQLHTLLQTLEFGINSMDADAMQSALEALAALAKFDYQSKRKGQPGLSTEAGTGRTSTTSHACRWKCTHPSRYLPREQHLQQRKQLSDCTQCSPH